mmetsp:Transcript_29923/g.68668  ORF Transcript_29923/g.68668 Transcript_29923/m.68668 type:complete len:83 (-) Transcript_29923:330-578(-)
MKSLEFSAETLDFQCTCKWGKLNELDVSSSTDLYQVKRAHIACLRRQALLFQLNPVHGFHEKKSHQSLDFKEKSQVNVKNGI